jgi:hypothetical protein
MSMSYSPIIHAAGGGHTANQMIRAMSAISIAERVEGARLSGISLPEWGISYPNIPPSPGATERFSGDRLMNLGVESIVKRMRRGMLQRVDIHCYAQHMENFLPVEFYRELFVDRFVDVPTFCDDEILIHIRGGDILTAVHSDYTLVPIDFYCDIVMHTGLRPVFIGQMEPNFYISRLRERFPDARVLPGQDPMRDFATIRRAKNILVSVSTFSWLAAWLSHAKKIIIPITGFYSPTQSPDLDLLPLGDGRYEFYLFPTNYAVPVEEHEVAHRAITGLWRPITPQEVMEIRNRMPTVCVDKEKYFAKFNEDYYLSKYPNIREAIAAGSGASGKEHFIHVGFYEGRMPFAFDRVSYARNYPDAAIETANGIYMDLLHHYVEVGEQKRYRPV